MQISKEKIDAVKRAHDLKRVIESYGIALKKKGGNYVGLCPFHEESTPSFTVNPKTSLYHCFGCNAGGDVIGFVCKSEGIGFREAMERLSNGNTQQKGNGTNGTGHVSKPATDNRQPATAGCARLLNRVVAFYHTTFLEDHRAMDYLKTRGITDNAIFTNFRIGFSNGTLVNRWQPTHRPTQSTVFGQLRPLKKRPVNG